ncbi:MAG: hypothetical protein ACK5QX_00905, partial [bacterium]
MLPGQRQQLAVQAGRVEGQRSIEAGRIEFVTGGSPGEVEGHQPLEVGRRHEPVVTTVGHDQRHAAAQHGLDGAAPRADDDVAAAHALGHAGVGIAAGTGGLVVDEFQAVPTCRLRQQIQARPVQLVADQPQPPARAIVQRVHAEELIVDQVAEQAGRNMVAQRQGGRLRHFLADRQQQRQPQVEPRRLLQIRQNAEQGVRDGHLGQRRPYLKCHRVMLRVGRHRGEGLYRLQLRGPRIPFQQSLGDRSAANERGVDQNLMPGLAQQLAQGGERDLGAGPAVEVVGGEQESHGRAIVEASRRWRRSSRRRCRPAADHHLA